MARILIAEDEPAVREFLARALSAHGHEVQTAADGSEALGALARAPFDLLLTDIVMPVLDGIALALKAMQTQPDLAIVLMTGYAAERQRAHNLDALIHAVIAKPFTMDEILATIDAALVAHGHAPGGSEPA